MDEFLEEDEDLYELEAQAEVRYMLREARACFGLGNEELAILGAKDIDSLLDAVDPSCWTLRAKWKFRPGIPWPAKS